MALVLSLPVVLTSCVSSEEISIRHGTRTAWCAGLCQYVEYDQSGTASAKAGTSQDPNEPKEEQ